MDDLKICFDALQAKAYHHMNAWRYYDGNHPIAFTNPKLAEVIPNGVVFKKNWCQVVVNTTRDRLKLASWNHEDQQVMDRAAELWKRVLGRNETRIYVAALTTGEGYLMIWPRIDGQGVSAYYHDPLQCEVIYEHEAPDVPRVACKRWPVKTPNGEAMRLNIYYPTHIQHYVAPRVDASTHGAFQLESEEMNPYGTIPLFRFCVDERRNEGELTVGVISLQDAMNKLLNDMMVASEYASFPQRWGIGQWSEDSKVPIGAGTLLKIPGSVEGEQPASVGAFPTSDPQNYLQSIGALSNDMAVLTGTPKHYFDPAGANVSGEALQALEGPLIAKVEMYQQILGYEWSRAMAFALKLDGMEVDAEDIEPVWTPPHTVQPMSQAQTRLTNTQAGIPLINLLRDEGWTDEQIDQLKEDAAAMPAPAAQQAQQQPPAAVPVQPGPARTPTPIENAVRTPDLAGQLASTGAITRAVNRLRGAQGN